MTKKKPRDWDRDTEMQELMNKVWEMEAKLHEKALAGDLEFIQEFVKRLAGALIHSSDQYKKLIEYRGRLHDMG